VPAVIRSISYPIEYEEKLVELGVDVTKRGTVSQAFRLLIDDAIQRLRAGNPVSVGETPKELKRENEELVSDKTYLINAAMDGGDK